LYSIGGGKQHFTVEGRNMISNSKGQYQYYHVS